MTEGEALRILHLSEGCSREQVRQAYKDLVKVWHPDRFQSDAPLREKADRTLRQVNEAYEVLQRPTATDGGAAGPERAPFHTVVPATSPARHQRRVFPAILVGSAIGVAVALAVVWRSSPTAPTVADSSESTMLNVELPPSVAPATPVPDPRHPESGSQLRSSAGTGTGRLSARNDTRDDAVVLLDRDAAHDRVFVVRGGAQVTLLDLPPGKYRVRVMLGTVWTGRAFQRAAGYYERETPAVVAAHEDARDARPQAVVIGDPVGWRPVPAFAVD